jgi:hypothetical protein
MTILGKAFGLFHRGERVTFEDFERVAELGVRGALDQLVHALLVGEDSSTYGYVVKGFEASVDGTELTINRGIAIASYKDRGETHYGTILTGGDASITRDLADLDDAEYTVWIRLAFSPSSHKNRPHWDAAAAPAREVVRNVPTQNAEIWTWMVESLGTTPGPEWMPIHIVTKAAGVLTLEDIRYFYFEGSSINSWQVSDLEWGNTDDRSDTRSTYGLFGLRRTFRAMMKEVQTMKGTTYWWRSLATVGAESLLSLTQNKLARDGSQTMTGNLNPDAADTRSIGNTNRWSLLNARTVTAAIVNLATGVLNTLYGDGTGERTMFFDSRAESTVGGALRLFRAMTAVADVRAIEATLNADFVGGVWSRDEAADAYKIQWSATAIRLLKHESGGAATWADTIAAGTWTQLFAIDLGSGKFSGTTTDVVVGDTANGVTVPNLNALYTGSLIKAWAVVHTGAAYAADGYIDLTNVLVHGCSLAVNASGDIEVFVHNKMMMPYGIFAFPIYNDATIWSGSRRQCEVIDDQHAKVCGYTNAGAAASFAVGGPTETVIVIVGEQDPSP